jgi:hypothetical protein
MIFCPEENQLWKAQECWIPAPLPLAEIERGVMKNLEMHWFTAEASDCRRLTPARSPRITTG